MNSYKRHFRSVLLVALFALTHTFGYAQKFYTGLSVGYGFPLASQNIPKDWGDWFIAIGSGPRTSNELLYSHAQYGSYGEGISLKLYGGYFIAEHISAEIWVSYLIGKSHTLTRSEINTNQYKFQSYKTGGNMLMLTPSVRYGIPKGRFYPYIRLGLVIGVFSNLNFERRQESVTMGFARSESVSVHVFSGGAGVGVSLSLGTDFKITDRFSLSASLSAIGMSYSPSKGKWAKYMVDGEDRLKNFSVNDREVRFVHEYGSQTSQSDEPSEYPKFWYPFSNIGFDVGVKYYFNLSKKKSEL